DNGPMQAAGIAGVTDGTSHTILAGEVLPGADSDNNFWPSPGALAGTTIPLGWDTESGDPTLPSCRNQLQRPWAPLNCGFSAAAKGFVSRHPGRAGFLFADGS